MFSLSKKKKVKRCDVGIYVLLFGHACEVIGRDNLIRKNILFLWPEVKDDL